jgi:hypothetical protein
MQLAGRRVMILDLPLTVDQSRNLTSTLRSVAQFLASASDICQLVLLSFSFLDSILKIQLMRNHLGCFMVGSFKSCLSFCAYFLHAKHDGPAD